VPADSRDSSRPLPTDLNAREVGLLIPLALAVIILGVYPNVVLKTIARPVQQLVAGAVNDQGTELAKLPVARPAPAHSSKR
jgi:NADH:ubiquinone oxidoreductase subunit 4 (subunit M)